MKLKFGAPNKAKVISSAFDARWILSLLLGHHSISQKPKSAESHPQHAQLCLAIHRRLATALKS